MHNEEVRDWLTSTGILFCHGETAPSGPGPPHYRGFTIPLRHTTLGRTPLDERSARRRDLHLTTQYSPETSMPQKGLKPRNRIQRAATDSRLRLRGLWH